MAATTCYCSIKMIEIDQLQEVSTQVRLQRLTRVNIFCSCIRPHFYKACHGCKMKLAWNIMITENSEINHPQTKIATLPILR